ncbi:uncharacterized protein SPSK_02038 [Sporothrix schenckii 1099-18]|uniref:Uncharacterized protein n=1 Tax=Sporothrix schenckii 1099-18 TaxID=1397361 RepID=A0A0F2MDG7_SPOSC|nr:uncharacterized protein SPSK_02038 [Sporothrix schenckii 1099-18]KJR86900.1 hypothetical protein SPSK_02038 [Sporothrix schenckii 1099-18]
MALSAARDDEIARCADEPSENGTAGVAAYAGANHSPYRSLAAAVAAQRPICIVGRNPLRPEGPDRTQGPAAGI